MKLTILTLVLSLIYSTSFSQGFNKSIKSEDFQLLKKNGILIVEPNDEEVKLAYKNAMKKYWTFSEYRFINLKEETPKPNDILLIEMMIGLSGSSLVFIKYEYFTKRNILVSNPICYMGFEGFTGESNNEVKKTFIAPMISGLNYFCTSIVNQNIKSKSPKLNVSVTESITQKTKLLKSKTLLIIGDMKEFTKEKGLKKAGVKYEMMSLTKYQELTPEDRSGYSLFYANTNFHLGISIFDLENMELAFTTLSIPAYRQHFYSTPEFSRLSKVW